MSLVIKVENLSKKYIISHQRQAPGATLREAITNKLKFFGRKTLMPADNGLPARSSSAEDFWALKDVSFEIEQGDRVGIIGRNGSGKSTLLKILSRITAPTGGTAKIKGRVASLLEVGTGFHPELTGRENIYLNGAVLGMGRAETKRKFDEIVDFAEVEKFLDTPVKRYSSGMYVRLAFAVAAHLEPEILVVDEVLAVGDIQFQKKCLAKMENVASAGRTILLVSHNMSTILGLSTKCMLLSEGRLIEFGPPRKVINAYQNNFYEKSFGQTDLSKADRYGNGNARFLSIFMKPFDSKSNPLEFPVTGCDLELKVEIEAYREIGFATVALIIYDVSGNRLIDVNTLIKGDSLSLAKNQRSTVRFRMKNVRLKPDNYIVGLWLGTINSADIDGIHCATSFKMEARREDILYTPPFPGMYACDFEHEIKTAR